MKISPAFLLVLAGVAGCSTTGTECDSFTEPTALATATIHVTNKRATSIYVSGCAPRFSVVVAGATEDGELPTWGNATCEEARTTTQGASGCESGPTEIASGASLDMDWSGLSYLSTTMPDGCYPDTTTAYSCYQGHGLAPGAVDVVFHFLATGDGSSTFDVTQTLQLASGATVNVDVN